MEDQQQQQEKPVSVFRSEIDNYIRHLEAQADVLPLVMSLVSVKIVQEERHVNKFIDENQLDKDSSEKGDEFSLPLEKFDEFIKLNDKAATSKLAYDLLPINFAVSFVSQYDAYLGGIIRAMFVTQPELLNSSEKNIALTELLKFSSLNEAKEFIIEKEVESVLRESHLKQFKWFENKLNITLRKDLPSFSDFIEITERRNLFVHCNGVVSRQYIDVCRENNVDKIYEVKLGDKLKVKDGYHAKCYSVLFEIGVKLGQVIWRKLIPEEVEEADTQLNNVCFQLLLKGHYRLALNLLTFATDTLKKHHDQEMVCIFNINKALAYYLSERKDECTKVLNKEDWSATNDKFKLAVAVLREDYDAAIKFMKVIGNNNSHITSAAYREWPLFKEFRKHEEFKSTYREIFNSELVYTESRPRDLESILSGLKELKGEST